MLNELIAGSRHASRGGSPVGILKGGKRSRDASKDRGGAEASKGRDLSKDRLAAEQSKDLADEGLTGKPLSRSASLKKSISFSKRTQEFDDAIEEKFVRAGQEPLQSGKSKYSQKRNLNNYSLAKDIFAAIADTSLESGMAKSRSGSKERPGSRTSGSGFPQVRITWTFKLFQTNSTTGKIFCNLFVESTTSDVSRRNRARCLKWSMTTRTSWWSSLTTLRCKSLVGTRLNQSWRCSSQGLSLVSAQAVGGPKLPKPPQGRKLHLYVFSVKKIQKM